MEFLTVDDGIRLCLDDEGEGEALIFAHGLNSNRLNNMDFYLNDARIP